MVIAQLRLLTNKNWTNGVGKSYLTVPKIDFSHFANFLEENVNIPVTFGGMSIYFIAFSRDENPFDLEILLLALCF